jgi:DNA-binding transcriptional regulator/RsmH inhibitor MraZ
VVIPQELVEYAKIERNIVVVGCGDYAEIWAEATYDANKAEIDVAELIGELEELGL